VRLPDTILHLIYNSLVERWQSQAREVVAQKVHYMLWKLSKWNDNETTSPEESEEVEELKAQLANLTAQKNKLTQTLYTLMTLYPLSPAQPMANSH
jgi:hypothetical protein